MAFDPNAGDVGPSNQSSDNTDWAKLLQAALAAAGGGLAGRALSNAGGDPLSRAVPPQLSQLLDNSVARQGYQNPLFQATTQGAYAMLPTFAKTGTQLSGSLPSTLPPAAPTSGGGVNGGQLAGGAGLGALAALLGKNGGNLSSIINGLKKLFGGGGNPGRKAPGPDNSGTNNGSEQDPYGIDYSKWPGGADPNDPMPNVTTTTDFGGVAGGFPNYPEDPNSAASNWWDLLPGAGGSTPGGDDQYGGWGP